MNKDTVITYEAGGRSVRLLAKTGSPLWVTDITGLSENTVDVSESQGAGQVGSTLSDLSVKPRDVTVSGAVLADVEANRRGLLACVLPGVIGRLTVTQNGERWYIEGTPTTTPVFTNGSAVQHFQFVLHCPYPWLRSTQDGSTQIAGLRKLFCFPCTLAGSWYISRYSESLFAAVVNTGSMATGFDAVFSALSQVTDPQLYHVEKRTFIKFNCVLAAGESLLVSTVYGRRGVTLQHADGSTENGFRFLDVSSDPAMQMDPGTNTLRCDAAENREGLQVRVQVPKGVIPGL